MKPFYKIKRNLFSIFQTGLVALLVVMIVVFVILMWSKEPLWIFELLGLAEREETKHEALKFVGIGMGGVLVALQALMSYKRAKAMEETANTQASAVLKTEEGQRQERMKNAIEHLGHESDSVRLGGAYELFHLAEDTEALRQTVLDILCAHIRHTTGQREYRKRYESKPSEEIQSLLTLLFVQSHCIFNGCHINLRESWLNGADLREARLEKAVLFRAHLREICLYRARLQGADLTEAQLQKAYLAEACMQEVSLVESHMQKAILWSAHLQRSILNNAYMHGAILRAAHLQETGLNGTHLLAADLTLARMQMASLGGAQMQGADLHMAQLHGATLRDAQLQGAHLRKVQLHEAKFSALQGLREFSQKFHGEVCPERAQLQGVRSSEDSDSSEIVHHIRDQKNMESDLSGMIFSGGMRQKDVDSSVEGLSDSGAEKLRERLERHVGQPISHSLPKDSGAVVGAYTDKEARKWIAEYEEATAEASADES